MFCLSTIEKDLKTNALRFSNITTRKYELQLRYQQGGKAMNDLLHAHLLYIITV